MNSVSYSAASPTSGAVNVLGPKVPPAPPAPLLKAAGNGKLRVCFAAPAAEPACSETAVYLRTVGAGGRLVGAWTAVNGSTKRLVDKSGQGNCVPIPTGEVVVEGLSAGLFEARVRTMNAVGFSDASPVSARLLVDDDDEVAIVGSQSWADRDRELRKRAIDIDGGGEEQPTERGGKRHRSRTPAYRNMMGPLRQHNEDNKARSLQDDDERPIGRRRRL